MNAVNDSPIGNVTTYTYQTEDQKAIEVLLLPLDRNALGTENSFPPPVLSGQTFSNWVRSGYFFLHGDVIAQLPRNASHLPLDQTASEVTDVVYTDGCLALYYPVDQQRAMCLSWEYGIDEWTAEYVEDIVADGLVDMAELDHDDANSTLVWSIDPEKYIE